MTSRRRSIDPRLWTGLGVVLLAAGCVLLGVAWGLAAGKTVVSLQLPYVMSAGFPGLGLVVVGIGLVIVGVREADARARRAQQQELLVLLGLLHNELVTMAAPTRSRRTKRGSE